MKYLKNALTAILVLTSFSVHCSSSDDDDENSLTKVASTSQKCDNQKDLFLKQFPHVLSTVDQASLSKLVDGYQGNFSNFAEASNLLFLRSGVCSQRNIVSALTILAEQNDPVSIANSCVPFLRNYDNAYCCDFIMNTVKKHDNADDTPKSFSEFCLDLLGKSMSIGGEFDQDSLVGRVADLLRLSKENTKLAIGYPDLEEAQRAAEEFKSAADDAKRVEDDVKRVADDAKRAADDAKRVADDAKRVVDDAKSAAKKAKSALAEAMLDANITSSDLEQMEIAADAAKRAANIAVSDSEEAEENAEENIVKQAMRAVKKAKSAASNLERKPDDAETDAEVNSVKEAMRAAKKAKIAANHVERRKTLEENRAKIAKRKADDAETAEVAAGVAKRKADDLERDADDARRIAEAKKQDVKLKINSLLVMDLVDKIRPSDREKVLNFIDKSITDMSSGADDKPVSFFELLASSVEK